MLEPSVKPKMYLVSISRNALSSYARTCRALDHVAPAANVTAIHRRAGRRARQEIRIELSRSAGFKAPQSSTAPVGARASDMRRRNLRCQQNKQMLERF